jgi:hypothetical protein
MAKNSKRNLKNINQNLDICYFCKKSLANDKDWCYIETKEGKKKAHYKCVATHQF